jgi:thiamine-monophosphate kinase
MRLLALDEGDRRWSATTADLLVQAHIRPEPRVSLGRLLLEHGATAAMDLSDGLMGDLPKILEASDVAAMIDARDIPVAAAVRALFPNDWLELAMRGGEDYELLFTAPRAKWPELAEAAEETGDVVTAIGEVLASEGRGHTITVRGLDGTRTVVAPGAFDHFEQPKSDIDTSAERGRN